MVQSILRSFYIYKVSPISISFWHMTLYTTPNIQAQEEPD